MKINLPAKFPELRFPAFAIGAMLFAIISGSYNASESLAQGHSDTIAKSGDAPPIGDGVFSGFADGPSINDLGQVLVDGVITGNSGGTTTDRGLYRGSGGALTQIVREGDASPDGNGSFSILSNAILTESGDVSFNGFMTGTSGGNSDDSGLFSGGGGLVGQVVREGEMSPDGNGTYSSFFSTISANSNGQIAFRADLTGTSGGTTDNQGMFASDGGSTTLIARKGQVAPDGNGTLSTMFPASNQGVNDSGQVAFINILSGTSGGTTDDRAIYRGKGGGLTKIAREGQASPDGNGSISRLSSVEINNNGMVVFESYFSGTVGGTTDDRGLFVDNGGTPTQYVREGQAAPDGNGTFGSSFSKIRINDTGQIVFGNLLNGTSGGATDNFAIYRGDGNSLTAIARRGQMAPDGKVFATVNNGILNDTGVVAFSATYTGGFTTDQTIYLGDGIDLIRVARENDLIDGVQIAQLSLSKSGINKHGQVAFEATLFNGDEVIRRFNPDLNYRKTTSGDWDDADNWTLGINPDLVHDVSIATDVAVSVNGPINDTNIRQLTIGGGLASSELLTQDTIHLTVANGVSVESNGILGGTGFIVGNVASNGIIAPGMSAGALTIDGTLTLLSSSILEIELDNGINDTLFVSNDLFLDGSLSVDLINGFQLSNLDDFLIADVGGSLTGQFNGLGEGGLVGSFGGRELFISYTAGDGNDVGLFTAVPEPSSLAIGGIGIALILIRRRRNGMSSVKA